ncbi:unnamed protein product [Darwinula stevensoni]|uniref:G-protein coupled receptors family 1 profile domain-containing protein n=1 Tax=Darwinula stevensoni TaxID=69355 RepID=A0A7R8XAY7_9CRUS|nr:unnamed protein product [Darwinula stevensoni]CAG0884257.1 unnamed protein product [Darwinula stevensoni]
MQGSFPDLHDLHHKMNGSWCGGDDCDIPRVGDNGSSYDPIPTLPADLQFNDTHMIQIVCGIFLITFSGIGNIFVLFNLRKRGRPLSRVNLLIAHLSTADLIVTFIMIPIETAWAITVSWRAGDVMCRLSAFCRAYGIYVSGFIITSISLDRYFAIMKPLTMAVFHVEHHPNYTWFEQCVAFNFFPTRELEIFYNLVCMAVMVGVPLFSMAICYGAILVRLYKRSRDGITGEDSGSQERVAGIIGRAKIKTLKMTVLLVLTFFFCWTPYNIMTIWYFVDSESARAVDPRLQKALFLFACANSCLNPLVYGAFKLHVKRQRFRLNLHPSKGRRRRRKSEFPVVWKANNTNSSSAGGGGVGGGAGGRRPPSRNGAAPPASAPPAMQYPHSPHEHIAIDLHEWPHPRDFL